MIYLQPEAQEKIISIFNFSLRMNGILLLGSAETVGTLDGRFAVISKPARLFRKIAPNGPGDFKFSSPTGELLRFPSRSSVLKPLSRPVDIADFSKRLVLETHSPASVLINQSFECLYLSGATERYLRVAQGYPTQDLRAMLQPALRARLDAAISKAIKDNLRVIIPGGRVNRDGEVRQFNIDITPVIRENERLFLICFIDQEKEKRKVVAKQPSRASSRVVALEKELKEARAEIDSLTQGLEFSNQEQNAINEEALSINEEFQSTNEELMTSKEELQSLNEELTALNGQLQETLERSRTTANDLKNVLYSTDVATLFLDTELKIRFFTPATKALFTLISGDIGRPLSDLHSLAADNALSADAREVLKNSTPIECDVEVESGEWFNRRILPYRMHDNKIAGVVITFTDITQRKKVRTALKAAQLDAERADIAKSRFLAAASHDLRQPLQTLALLSALLAKITAGSQAQKLLKKIDETANSMGTILNTLLDINQIDAGIVKPVMESFPINEIFHRLNEEFVYIAESRGLTLRVVPCSLHIRTDPRILEQMIRNLLSNAIKYTKKGRVLIGCRRGARSLRIEVWDTGLGIPEVQLKAIFDEYHQVNNMARERSLGLGLGLSIVQRLGDLLGHRIEVRSTYGKGSVFSIEADIAEAAVQPAVALVSTSAIDTASVEAASIGSILIIEDDPDIRQLLEIFLVEEGHVVAAASDGESAIKLVAADVIRPDLVIVDYNLPNGADGVQVIAQLRTFPLKPFAAIVCTGDISTKTLKTIAQSGCTQLSKPMKLDDLNIVIQQLLSARRLGGVKKSIENIGMLSDHKRVILIIDDDVTIRTSMRALFEANGNHVETFADCEEFIAADATYPNACLLVDANLPGMSGFELLQKRSAAYSQSPAIMITGQGDVKMAVLAIKAGAFDFIEKPISQDELLDCVNRAFEQSKGSNDLMIRQENAFKKIASLTSRQRQIMDMVLAGQASKNIAVDLGISQRTVENHRASIMERTGTKSIAALARLAVMAMNSSEVSI
jgi:two-component system CheB/CheR fusion protein